MSTILLLAEDENTLNKWDGIFNIASDHHKIKSELLKTVNFSELDLNGIVTVVIVCVQERLNELTKLFDVCQKSKTPVIVSKNIAQQFKSLRHLIDSGVAAIIDFEMSILAISKIFSIVEKGGFYLDPIMMDSYS
ncbi:Uncharacterised protein [Lysinibacillus capsici]|uniref:Uncharacterized protein n=1 Tax=Lysinibacillus capsici TaxID=2115968 RepID=A0A2X1C1M1_9BACI|nr:hypothetical protein [Lysinibacillus capsici]SPU40736.1 Uncharacterised protein [Lysinibacillus capsici]